MSGPDAAGREGRGKMIIVMTHDGTIRSYYGNYIGDRRENFQYWERVRVLDERCSQRAATGQLRGFLAELGPDEPLCLVGHVSDETIGDARPGGGSWMWSATDIAELLRDFLPEGYLSDVLIESGGGPVEDFLPTLAQQLEDSSRAGVWVHGHRYRAGTAGFLPSAAQLGEDSFLAHLVI